MNERIAVAVQRPTARTAPVLQRKCACGGSGGASGECADCKKKKLQRRAAGNGPETAPPIVHEVLRSPGQPLDPKMRSFFEPRFGHDFSRVRVHTDAEAAESAHALNALAYTVGRRIVFGPGQYRPGDPSGKRLLAHELTHVVQQGTEALAGGPLRVGPVGDSHEHEAERVASAAESKEVLKSGHASTGIQRQSADPSPDASAATNQGGGLGPGGASSVPQPETCTAPPDLPTAPDLGCNPTKDPVTGVFRTVNFEVDKYNLAGDASAKIHEAADEWRKRGSPGKVRVDGYASPEYECEYNWRLSCHRARAVANELKNPSGGNVPEGQIEVYAHGESLEAGNTLAPNRRAMISLPAAPPPKRQEPEPEKPPQNERKCGPDITSALSATLTAVGSYFSGGLSPWQRRRSCMALTGDAPLAGVNPIMAWDVEELFLPNTGWLDRYFRSGGCGSPRDPGCDTDPTRDRCETDGTCGNSVLVGGRCMLAGTANYAIYGKMFRLCSDEFFYYWGGQMRNLIRLYKLVGGDDSGPPLAMANAAFDGTFPTVPAAAENRGSCTARCGVTYPGNFHFIWEPYKSR
jgi:outer membrane protein OmpA-like peptidoglycan-associated protein